METYTKRTPIDASAEDLFAYHEAPGAFMRLNPPWEPVEIEEHTGGIQDGAEVKLKLRIGPVPQRWHLTHQNYVEGRQFEDRQITGPFAHWVHTHKMEPTGDNQSILEDHIKYQLPLGILGSTFGGAFARAKTDRMFTYRHEITTQDLQRHQAYKDVERKTIAVTGASGLIGSQLVPFLATGGHTVKRLVRSQSKMADDTILFDIHNGQIGDLSGVNAVVHLAGESIGDKRWTPQQRREVMESRTKGTTLLAETLAKMDNKPDVLISASAIGYYGDRGDEILTEDSPSGDGFQAEVCRAWEASLQPAIDAGIRVVTIRFGVVLSMSGGALKRMLLPFQMGAGGVLGSGQQYFSWIALDDAVDIIHHAIMHEEVSGAVNAVAPEAVTNRDYTHTLGKVLRRPTLIPVPGFGLRLAFGQLADELLLASIRVKPCKLEETGYNFRYPELEGALRHLLGKVK